MKNLTYTKSEQEYLTALKLKCEKARDRQRGKFIELDDATYTEAYEANFKAGNSYIPAKKNKNDTRIVTGTTLEKENTFLSSILNFNLEPAVTAYDEKDMPIARLGTHLTSLIKKSRLLEDYESKRPLIYKEGADQGTWFAEMSWVEETEIIKDLKEFDPTKPIDKVKWTEKRRKKIIGCQTNLLPGTSVYLGDVKQFFMRKQPYVVIKDVITYDEAKACYEDYDRFQFVPKVLVKTGDDETERDWTMCDLVDGYVEVVKFYDKWANEYMLMLNGVMMFPVGFPLTYISPSGEYPVAKGDIEPISEFFAYSKSYPAKTKVDQALLDDIMRTLTLKMRQLLKPTMVNNTNRVLSDKIFDPGTIIDNVNPNQLTPLFPSINGISAGEFQVFQLIKQIID